MGEIKLVVAKGGRRRVPPLDVRRRDPTDGMYELKLFYLNFFNLHDPSSNTDKRKRCQINDYPTILTRETADVGRNSAKF